MTYVLIALWLLMDFCLLRRIEKLEEDGRTMRTLIGRLHGRLRDVEECSPVYEDVDQDG